MTRPLFLSTALLVLARSASAGTTLRTVDLHNGTVICFDEQEHQQTCPSEPTVNDGPILEWWSQSQRGGVCLSPSGMCAMDCRISRDGNCHDDPPNTRSEAETTKPKAPKP